MDERHEDELLQAVVSGGLLRELAADRELFLALLAQGLEAIVPERVTLRRAGGWFRRERPIRAIEVDLGDHRYGLAAGKGGALSASRTRVVRGIAIRTDELPVEEWLQALSGALVEYARTHEEALAALKRRVW
jgi:hypothetical protein